MTKTTAPDNSVTLTFYSGYKTASLDALGRQVIRETDAFGRLIKVQEYLGAGRSTPAWTATPAATTRYAYNVMDGLTETWDTANHHTQIGYDSLGRKTSLSDPDMGAWSYTYDAAGNLLTQTDGRGSTLWFAYDLLHRVKEKRLQNSSGQLLAGYFYDEGGHGAGKGQRTHMTDGSGSTSWSYDDRGRVSSETQTIDGTPFTTGYTYRADDQVLTVGSAVSCHHLSRWRGSHHRLQCTPAAAEPERHQPICPKGC